MERSYVVDVQSILTADITEARVAFTVSISLLTVSFQLRAVVSFSWSRHRELLHCPDSLALSEFRMCMSVPLAYPQSGQRIKKAPQDVNIAHTSHQQDTQPSIQPPHISITPLLDPSPSLTALSAQLPVLDKSTITTTNMNIYLLLGGMTLFVSAILYSVITRLFYIPETLPRRRRSSRRYKTRWYETWFNAGVAPIVKYFLYLHEMICAALATLHAWHAWITKIFRTPDGLQQNRRSAANANRCEHYEAHLSSASRTLTRAPRSTRAPKRTTGSRAPPPTPISSSGNSSRAPTRSAVSTGVYSRATRSQSHPPSPASSSGDDTLVGTPSRAPSTAPENNNTQATQRRGRPTRLCEIKAFIAAALEAAPEVDVSLVSWLLRSNSID